MLNFLVGFILGSMFGLVVTALIVASGNRTREEEAYYKGIEDGKAMNRK